MTFDTKSVVVDGARIDYVDVGTGPVLVFVHGVYVSGAIWRDVIAQLAPAFRCIVPTWLFGGHAAPAGDGVDLGVVASGRRLTGLLDALDLTGVTLIANDTGGGVLLAALGDSTLNFDRVSRLVFTNCDSFEDFPPKVFAPLVGLCALSERLGAALLRGLATRLGRKVFTSVVSRDGIAADDQAAVFGGFIRSAGVRRDAARFTGSLRRRYTMGAVSALKACPVPVLMAWGTRDKLFPLSHAHRLAQTFPHGQVRAITGSSTYVMIDAPAQTAMAISEFVAG